MSDTELLHKAINSAKNFENFQDVLMAVSLHPEWLTIIPDDRKWAILHQIIFSGDVEHLDQLLALQKSNQEFRLLTNTRDKETVLDIANLRQDAPKMIKRIEQLIKLDEMLNYAKICQWEECYKIAKENPTFVNEKPPYRRYYLIHHMATANAIKEFERFTQIKGCKFDLTLRADRKKINVIAREENCPQFAEYIEKQYPILLDENDPEIDDVYKPSEKSLQQTKAITLMVQKNVVKDLDEDLMGEAPKPQKSRHEVVKHLAAIRSQHEKEQNHASNAALQIKEEKRKVLVLDTLTCPLTLAVFVDPGKHHWITLKLNIYI
jgi:hypothetical protein